MHSHHQNHNYDDQGNASHHLIENPPPTENEDESSTEIQHPQSTDIKHQPQSIVELFMIACPRK